ncbi:uncharacterized protein N7469_000260 [Penicillium citrinum]|uniref:Uncharacterized protein n=2 Tax=Penicillium TaxID=5073 RepID=A0A9W9PFF3_PENCI|nr:uncharacterized protein N7469_000260 [Penicillium citrinum]KAJ5241933.1 hypothetical protein N7469_000260 [Penicillium citrinum]KAJ5600575.1 hypothetical protein N7450_001642 [Penicillium hetheringtonii]KAK5807354.1 hypothetical protein VI817_001612 [Penicillium citrinum]
MKSTRVSSRLSASSVNFIVRYNPRHTIPVVASRYLTSPGHPLRPKISHMWDNRSKDELWWRVNINLQLSQYKRVVRSWAARRARLAFRQALAHHGLDITGHPLPSNSHTPPDPLLGSMEVFVQSASLTHKFDVIQEDANYLLQVILNRKKLREQKAGSAPAA